MPRYDYRCPECGVIVEIIMKISEIKYRKVICRECTEKYSLSERDKVGMERIISKSCAIHGDSAPWIPSVNGILTGKNDPPITNRTEYKRFLKEKQITPTG
jgi:putative FmdB family regulatory protein